MMTTNSILNNRNNKIIYNHPEQHPVAIQIAGCIPSELAKCAQIADKNKYNEINLNIGCPSKSTQMGLFGVCLMKKKNIVIDAQLKLFKILLQYLLVLKLE